MRKLLTLILLATLQYTYPAPGPGRQAHGGASCSIPSGTTSRWYTWNPGTTCVTIAGACSNGLGVYLTPDSVGGNTAGQSNTGLHPTYTTGSINSLAAAVYNSDYLEIATPIASGSGSMSWLAILEPTAYGATGNGGAIITNIGTPRGAPLWYISSGGQQVFASAGSPSIITGSATISTSHYSAIFFNYNYSTGAANMWIYSSGTFVSDGTATATESWSQPIDAFGYESLDNLPFKGPIVELDYWNSAVNPNTVAANTYVACQYAL